MKTFTLDVFEKPDVFARLIEEVFNCSRTCSLIVRSSYSKSIELVQFLEQAKNDLVEVVQVDAWPGTKLLDGWATLYRYTVTPRFRRRFIDHGSNLKFWMHPNLPEDPAFYREDGSVIFGSIVHEMDAFLIISSKEAQRFAPFLQAEK